MLGKEGAGEVLVVGEGVSSCTPGDRVAYTETMGAYAEQTVVPEHFLVYLPDAIDFDTAAASMLKGLTAHFLKVRFPPESRWPASENLHQLGHRSSLWHVCFRDSDRIT